MCNTPVCLATPRKVSSSFTTQYSLVKVTLQPLPKRPDTDIRLEATLGPCRILVNYTFQSEQKVSFKTCTIASRFHSVCTQLFRSICSLELFYFTTYNCPKHVHCSFRVDEHGVGYRYDIVLPLIVIFQYWNFALSVSQFFRKLFFFWPCFCW